VLSICLFDRKGTELNSSIFLTLIVAITVGQATYNIVKEQSLSKIIFYHHFLFVCGMVTYALIYRGVTILMSDMPMVVVPLSLSAIEIAFGMLFLAGFYNEVRYLPQLSMALC
jgi:NAD(P)H-quinone oxidoreductase subunit 5